MLNLNFPDLSDISNMTVYRVRYYRLIVKCLFFFLFHQRFEIRPRTSNLIKFHCRISPCEVVKMFPEIGTKIRFWLKSFFTGINSDIFSCILSFDSNSVKLSIAARVDNKTRLNVSKRSRGRKRLHLHFLWLRVTTKKIIRRQQNRI